MAVQKKKGETKNQHYVPQFYQRNFSKDDKTIGALVLSTNKYISQAPIKSQSSGDYFYSDNMKIEKALGQLEKLSNVVINKIIENPTVKLSEEDAATLYVFTMIQAGRTVFQVDLIKQSSTIFFRKALKKIFEIKRKNRETDDLKDLTEDIIDNLELKFNSIGMMALGTQAQLINMCRDLKYKILINKSKTAFITSDNPAVTYDIFMERMKQIYALGSRGLLIYLPLSPHLAVFYYDPECYKVGEKKKNYVYIENDKDIDELNKLIISKSSQVIYFNPDDYSEYKIKNIAGKIKKYRIDQKVESYPDIKTSEGNPIIGSYHKPIFCNLSLTFMKELPKFASLKPCQYNPSIHRLREIAYYKDILVRK